LSRPASDDSFGTFNLSREGQITDRFTKAIEQLGSLDDKGKPKLEIRLGGIYALERIARDSERDHTVIMEVLTTYVREHSPRKADDPKDQKTPQKPPKMPVVRGRSFCAQVQTFRQFSLFSAGVGLSMTPKLCADSALV
jgi:hypothetical protein